MRTRSLLLPLLLVSSFAAAGNLECNRETRPEEVPSTYRCVYHNGNLAQAYTALRANRSANLDLRLNFPHLPNRLPVRNFKYSGQEQDGVDENGKRRLYPVEISIKHPAPGSAVIEYSHQNHDTFYSHKTQFQRKGRNVEITITVISS